MEQLKLDDIRQLLQDVSPVRLSLYLPTHRIQAEEPGADGRRFKQLLDQATARLEQPVAAKLQAALNAAYDLVGDEAFWKHQSDGLAVFMSESTGLRYFRLAVAFHEAAYVEPRFYVSPLTECLQVHQAYFVLAISEDTARLFEGTADGLTEATVPGMPKNQADALWYLEDEKQSRSRAEAGTAGSYHGEGDDTRQPHAKLHEYLLKINAATTDFLARHREPLVVVAGEPALGLFKKLCRYDNLADGVEVNPHHLSPAELHQRAWEIVAAEAEAPKREILSAYAYYRANQSERSVVDTGAVIAAAKAGRIDSLLVGRPALKPEPSGFHERIPAATDGDVIQADEAVETAVQHTLLTSGRICLVPAEEMPDGSRLAAVMRY